MHDHTINEILKFYFQNIDNVVAWQRFLPNGVIALLPLSSNLGSIVWSTDTKCVKDLLQLPETAFIDAVNQAFVSQCTRAILILHLFFNFLCLFCCCSARNSHEISSLTTQCVPLTL